MKVIEGAIFLSLAGAVHVAALTLSAPQDGSASGGLGGTASVTVAAISPQLATLVEEWEKPPSTSDAPTLKQMAEAETITPPMASADAIPHRVAALLPSITTPAPVPLPDSRPPTPLQMQNLPPAPKPEWALPDAGAAPQSPAAQTPPTRPAMPAPMATVRPQADTAPVVDRQVTSKSLAPSQSPRPKARPETLARNATPKPTPKPKATQTIAPRAAQKAAGNGGSTASRTTAQTSKPSKGPSAAALQSAQAAWGAKIRQRVARAQRYPNGTRATGVALMQITVTHGGNVSAVRLVRSSGDAALDAAAVQAIRRARLPAAPKKLAKSSYSFNLPLRFARK